MSRFTDLDHDLADVTKLTYDTVWAMALTFQKVTLLWREEDLHRKLSDFNYETGSEIKDDFMEVFEALDFIGVSVSSI